MNPAQFAEFMNLIKLSISGRPSPDPDGTDHIFLRGWNAAMVQATAWAKAMSENDRLR